MSPVRKTAGWCTPAKRWDLVGLPHLPHLPRLLPWQVISYRVCRNGRNEILKPIGHSDKL
jgi:hypothetical protein